MSNEYYPKISIVTVCFNSERTIEQTIFSVINQTYKNIEYIIIDGKSTDGTVGIIKKYQDKIAYWVSEPDGGIYDAMNKGIEKATGEIIGIINSDDWLDLNTVQNVVDTLKKNECDIVHGDVIITKVDGTPYARYSPPRDFKRIWYDLVVYHPTCFVKKKVYDNYGVFATKYQVAGDVELLLRFYLNKCSFFYNEDALVYFRVGGVSDKTAELGYKEVRDISLVYGYSKSKAYFWWIYKSVKTKIIRLMLSNQLLARILNFYRSFKKNVVPMWD